jgi:hypothetical protein
LKTGVLPHRILTTRLQSFLMTKIRRRHFPVWWLHGLGEEDTPRIFPGAQTPHAPRIINGSLF